MVKCVVKGFRAVVKQKCHAEPFDYLQSPCVLPQSEADKCRTQKYQQGIGQCTNQRNDEYMLAQQSEFEYEGILRTDGQNETEAG